VLDWDEYDITYSTIIGSWPRNPPGILSEWLGAVGKN